MRHETHSRLRRQAALTAVLIATLGVAAACGGTSRNAAIRPGAGQRLAGMPGGDGMAPMPDMTMPDMTMPANPNGAGAQAQAQTAPVAGQTVDIKNFAFAPSTLTVKVGTTVTWINKDADAHTVTSQQHGPLKSAPLSTGNSYSYTFTTPGTYNYLCTIHPFMTATVTVTP